MPRCRAGNTCAVKHAACARVRVRVLPLRVCMCGLIRGLCGVCAFGDGRSSPHHSSPSPLPRRNLCAGQTDAKQIKAARIAPNQSTREHTSRRPESTLNQSDSKSRHARKQIKKAQPQPPSQSKTPRRLRKQTKTANPRWQYTLSLALRASD